MPAANSKTGMSSIGLKESEKNSNTLAGFREPAIKYTEPVVRPISTAPKMKSVIFIFRFCKTPAKPSPINPGITINMIPIKIMAEPVASPLSTDSSG